MRPLLIATIFSIAAFLVSAGSNEESIAWLEENAKKESVITLPSGLQYKVLKEGDGTDHPASDTPCECHYKGTLIDGTEFDSSYGRGEPTTFAPNQVIKGWTEAMQLMVEGDKWEMYIPSELAYGDRGSPPNISPGDALIFTMEILKIKFVCDPLSLKGCNEKEKEYVAKAKTDFGGDVDFIEEELDRLNKLSREISDDTTRGWINLRVGILNQLLTKAEEEDEF